MAASIDNLEINVTGSGFAPVPTLSGPIQGPDPVDPADLTTKSWVLSTIAGGGITYTATSPISVVAANIAMTPASQTTYGYVTTGAQTIAGVKTFTNTPKVPLTPVANVDVASKGYVDTTVTSVISGLGALTATAPLDLSAGVISMPAANSGADGYLTFGAQDIGGVKTFTSLPTIPLTPLADTDAASKGYADSLVTTTTVNLTMSGAVSGSLSTTFVKSKGFVWMTTEWFLSNATATAMSISLTGIPAGYQMSSGRITFPVIISNSVNNQISMAVYNSASQAIEVFGGLVGETFTSGTAAYFQLQTCWKI